LSDNFGTVTYDGVDQTVFSDVYYNLTAGGGSRTKTLGGNVTVANDLIIDTDVTIAMDTHLLTVTDITDIDGTLAVTDNILTLNGSSDIDGTITISTGIVDANGAFDAENGSITFTGAGNLTLFSTVTDLGTLSITNGTVIYDGIDQVVFSDFYYNLRAGGGSGTKTLGGNVTVENDLKIDPVVTIAMDTHLLTVTNIADNDGILAVADNTLTLDGTSDIDGTITISTGTVDANDTFDATGGFVTFTDAGNLNLDSTVTSLGTLSTTNGTVTYDASGDQDIVADVYYSLTAGGGSGTKTLGGAVTVANDLIIDPVVTIAMDTHLLQ